MKVIKKSKLKVGDLVVVWDTVVDGIFVAEIVSPYGCKLPGESPTFVVKHFIYNECDLIKTYGEYFKHDIVSVLIKTDIIMKHKGFNLDNFLENREVLKVAWLL